MSVATSYAKALYASAAEGKSPADLVQTCDRIEKELDLIITGIESSREAKVALFGPLMNAKDKAQVVGEMAAKSGADKLVGQFLTLLANKGRLGLLPQIRDEFGIVRLEAEGGVRGRLVSAEPMSDADVATLAKAFSAKLGKKVQFRMTVDASLLAGVKVTVNGVTYDGTLRSQLHQLRDRVLVGSTT